MKTIRRVCPQVVVAGTLVALPAIFFYGILFRKAIDLPLEDDYEALLEFLNNVVALHGIPAKSSYFLASMFNEYKIFFGHAVAWVQLLLIGHVSIRLPRNRERLCFPACDCPLENVSSRRKTRLSPDGIHSGILPAFPA